MNLIDIAHLRGICQRLGIQRVNFVVNTLVCKFAPNVLPDPAALFAALEKTDKRLLLSANKEPALLLRDPKLTIEEMLREAVKLLEKVETQISEFRVQID